PQRLSHPPISTLFPYTTLFRSALGHLIQPVGDLLDRRQQQLLLVGEMGIEGRPRDAGGPGDLVDRQIPFRRQAGAAAGGGRGGRSEEHTSELQSLTNLVCRLLL